MEFRRVLFRSAAGASDRLAVTGDVTIEGGTVQVLAEAGDYQPVTDYAIITAGGAVDGTFDAVTSNLAFLTPSLAYAADSVTLTLIRNDLSFASAGVTRNQRAAGAAVDHAFAPDRAVYANLVGASVAQAQAAFDHISGELPASAVRSEEPRV